MCFSDTNRLFFFGIYVFFLNLFLFLFFSDRQVVTVSNGNTYHCSWNIYGQSTFGRIFLDSIDTIDLIPYSFIIDYFIFSHVLMGKRLGY